MDVGSTPTASTNFNIGEKMKELEMEKGMHVIIAEDISRTAETHTVTHEMMNMKGKAYTIEAIRDSRYGMTAKIKSFSWHYDDLKERLAPEKKAQMFHFNVDRLVI